MEIELQINDLKTIFTGVFSFMRLVILKWKLVSEIFSVTRCLQFSHSLCYNKKKISVSKDDPVAIFFFLNNFSAKNTLKDFIARSGSQKFKNIQSCRWGSSVPGLRTQDPLLGPQSTGAKKIRRTCLLSQLQTSPPTTKNSYLKFWNPKATFEF